MYILKVSNFQLGGKGEWVRSRRTGEKVYGLIEKWEEVLRKQSPGWSGVAVRAEEGGEERRDDSGPCGL